CRRGNARSWPGARITRSPRTPRPPERPRIGELRSWSNRIPSTANSGESSNRRQEDRRSHAEQGRLATTFDAAPAGGSRPCRARVARKLPPFRSPRLFPSPNADLSVNGADVAQQTGDEGHGAGGRGW